MSQVPDTPGIACPECGKLRAALDQAQQQIARLQAEVHELRCQLNRNSSNSSSPPSADPPGAPKPVVKTAEPTPAGRATGASRTHRRRLPPDRVQQDRALRAHDLHAMPGPLPQQPAPGDPEPTWHQVAEIPPLAAIVTEHQGHARTCPGCGQLNRARFPRRSGPMSSGRALAAVMSYLSGRHHLSRRGVEEIVETAFEVPISLGTVVASGARDDGRSGRCLSRGPGGSPAARR